MGKSFIFNTYKTARKAIIAVVGGTIIIFGVALIFLPGPAFVVIPIGLAVLSIEFAWARRLIRRLQAESKKTLHKVHWFKKKQEPHK